MADRTTTNKPGETREQAPQSQPQKNQDLSAAKFMSLGPENQFSAEMPPFTQERFKNKWERGLEFPDSGARVLIKVLEGTNAA